MTGPGTDFFLNHNGEGESLLHRISGISHLLALLAVLVSLISFGRYEILGLLPFILYPLGMMTAGRQLPWPVFKIYLTVMPLFLCFFLSNLIFGGEKRVLFGLFEVREGLVSGLSLVLRGSLSVLSVLSFVSLKGFGGLLGAMKKLKIPMFFILVLSMMVRYIAIMVEEAVIMTRAYHMRAPMHKGIYWRDWGPMGGQWFIRTFRRGERIRCAMDLRGGEGEYLLESYQEGFRLKDFFWTLFWLLFSTVFSPAGQKIIKEVC